MIVLVGSEKGGTGKTTIATNLAVMRASVGRDVILIDTDPQGSSTIWHNCRTEYALEPVITCLSKTGPSTGHEIVKLRSKYDDIVIDAGGRDSLEMRSAMVIADKMIIPIKPSQFDTWTLTPMERLVFDARARGNEALFPLVCLNLVSPNPVLHEDDEAISLIKEFDALKVADFVIHDRVAFRRAAREGCSVAELVDGNNSKSILEITQLYDSIYNHD